MALIEKEPIMKFIEDGLNNKHYGHVGVEIITEIEYTPTIDAVPVVRCKDCVYYKKAHVLTNDGQEKNYEEMPEEAFDDCFSIGVTVQYGINVGSQCTLDCDRGYAEDKGVFRSPNDFCSRGCRSTT